ncbi:hypothetical protein GQ600_5201 [Phytophthora cactorum]|nr:hypothetical protein GQ600_5201 [Phytophthora cactorum]
MFDSNTGDYFAVKGVDYYPRPIRASSTSTTTTSSRTITAPSGRTTSPTWLRGRQRRASLCRGPVQIAR